MTEVQSEAWASWLMRAHFNGVEPKLRCCVISLQVLNYYGANLFEQSVQMFGK